MPKAEDGLPDAAGTTPAAFLGAVPVPPPAPVPGVVKLPALLPASCGDPFKHLALARAAKARMKI